MGSSESTAWVMIRKTPPMAGVGSGFPGGSLGPHWIPKTRNGAARAPIAHDLAFMMRCSDERSPAVRGMDLGSGPQSVDPAEGVPVQLQVKDPGLCRACSHDGIAGGSVAVSLILPETEEKELSTKGREERRRTTKALRLTATGHQASEGMVDFRLFQSRMTRLAGRGRLSAETIVFMHPLCEA